MHVTFFPKLSCLKGLAYNLCMKTARLLKRGNLGTVYIIQMYKCINLFVTGLGYETLVKRVAYRDPVQ